jgi:cystathionine beta-lyase
MATHSLESTFSRKGIHSAKTEEMQAKFGTSALTPLWVADIDFASPEAVSERIEKRLQTPLYGITTYPKSYFDAIRRWYQTRHDIELKTKEIVPVDSILVGMDIAIEAFSQIGDKIITVSPIYAPFLSMPKRHKRELLECKMLLEEGEYRIDFKAFEQFAKAAKIVLFCNPHNPIAKAYNLPELEEIARIVKKHHLIVISDEVHSDIVFSAHHLLSRLIPEHVITLNSPAKSFGVAGFANAYAIIFSDSLRRTFKQSALRLVHIHRVNIVAIETMIACYTQSDAWLEAMLTYLQSNIAFVKQSLHSTPIQTLKHDATFLMWLNADAIEDKEALFIDKAKVGVNFGQEFGDARFVRLNIATQKRTLANAIKSIQANLPSLKKNKR